MNELQIGSIPDYLNAVVALGVGIAVWRLGSVQGRVAQEDRVKESRVILSYAYPELAILKLHLANQGQWIREHLANFVHDEPWRTSVLGRLQKYKAASVSSSFARLHVLPPDQASQLGNLMGNIIKLHSLAETFADPEHPRNAQEWTDIGLYLASEMEQYAKEIDEVLNVIRTLNLRIDAVPKAPPSGEFG